MTEVPPPEGGGANDRDRTRDNQDHNLVLYQLSYARHRAGGLVAQTAPAVKSSHSAYSFGIMRSGSATPLPNFAAEMRPAR